MKKKKAIITLLVAILSIALIILVCIYFLDNTGKVNQGNFRINDAVLESYITVEETQEDNVTELSNIVMNITQENKLSLLIANNSNISSMYIDNISTTAPEKLGELKIKQEGKEDSIDCFNKEGKYDLNVQKKDEQYFVELKIINNNCLQNVNVPSETKVIKYDGTILDLLNRKIEEFKFSITFNLNIVEESGKLNTCKISLDMPEDTLITNGASVTRLDNANLLFTVK